MTEEYFVKTCFLLFFLFTKQKNEKKEEIDRATNTEFLK